MRLIDADALIEFCAERWIPLNIDAVNMQPTIQPEKAQLSQEGTTKDAISRQHALEKVRAMQTYKLFMGDDMILVDKAEVQTELMMLPPAQPEPTDEQVVEYCKKRCLHVVTDDFFRAAQPEPHEGHWIDKGWNGDWAWQK